MSNKVCASLIEIKLNKLLNGLQIKRTEQLQRNFNIKSFKRLNSL